MKRMMVEELNLRWPVCPGAILIRIVLSALAATLGVAAAQPTHGAETLRWKFKPGETLRYTMVQETTQGMKAMGQEFKTSLNQTVDLHWSVKNVASDGVAELSQTIDRVRTKVEGPGNSFEFDSQAGKDPEGQIASLLTPMLKALVGAEFTFKMNGRGELSEIKVPQKLLDSLRQAGPAANAGGMFSEEGMKNLISQSSLTLAEGPLEKGKSWTQQAKVPVPMLGTMVMDKTYTFDGPSPKEAWPGPDLAGHQGDSGAGRRQQHRGEDYFSERHGRVRVRSPGRSGRFLPGERQATDVPLGDGAGARTVDRHDDEHDSGQGWVVEVRLCV